MTKIIMGVGVIACGITLFGTVQWLYLLAQGMVGVNSWGYYVGTAFVTVGLIVPH